MATKLFSFGDYGYCKLVDIADNFSKRITEECLSKRFPEKTKDYEVGYRDAVNDVLSVLVSVQKESMAKTLKIKER